MVVVLRIRYLSVDSDLKKLGNSALLASFIRREATKKSVAILAKKLILYLT